MSDDLQKGSIYNLFSKLYHTRVKLSNKKAELEEEIDEKLKEQTILKTILKHREEENKNINKLINKDFTFTLSKGSDTYFEVLDISWSNNKNEETVFLYKAKRVYQSYKEENNKMTYLCEIKNNKFCISADDGKEWKGDNVWKIFIDDFQFNCEFKTIEHFFGLTYKPVQARIDKSTLMIHKHLEEIRNKIKKINVHNEQLKLFNYKMEALLVSIDTYSVPCENKNTNSIKNITDDKKSTKLNINKIQKERSTQKPCIPDLEKISNILKNESIKQRKVEEIIPPDMSHTFLDTSLLFDNKNDLLSRALSDKNLCKSNKSHLMKILDLLNNNKEGILWEDLIQQSGVPRYKCIEILNCLVKTDPPIMIKRRDKGFTCFINKSLNYF